jgi:hypothetical protein
MKRVQKVTSQPSSPNPALTPTPLQAPPSTIELSEMSNFLLFAITSSFP